MKVIYELRMKPEPLKGKVVYMPNGWVRKPKNPKRSLWWLPIGHVHIHNSYHRIHTAKVGGKAKA